MTSEQRYDRDFAELWGDVPRPLQESVELIQWMYRQRPHIDLSQTIIHGFSAIEIIDPLNIRIHEAEMFELPYK